jgi:hypothetical protein
MEPVSNKILASLRTLIAACEADPRLHVAFPPHLANLVEKASAMRTRPVSGPASPAQDKVLHHSLWTHVASTDDVSCAPGESFYLEALHVLTSSKFLW